jgi:uncharacterized protein (DUF433 family)
MDERDPRVRVPLYSVSEAARYLGVSRSTFSTWVDGYVRGQPGRRVVGEPIVTALPSGPPGQPRVPFVGIAEGYVLQAFRLARVPLQRIRPALARLGEEFGLAYVLASRRLYTDGAEVLWDYAEDEGDTPEARSARQLVVVRNGQRVFSEIVEDYLQQVSFADDGYAQRIRLRRYGHAEVVLDPRFGFGHPTFVHGRVRVNTALGAIRAGEPVEVVARDYGIPVGELHDAYTYATAA